jgi:hypothetical protein
MDPPEGGKTVAPLVGRERLLERYVFWKEGDFGTDEDRQQGGAGSSGLNSGRNRYS